MHCVPITAPLRIRAHSDQRLILDRAPVQDRLVTHGHPGADGQRRAGVRMTDRSVLEVRFLAQQDGSVVSPDDRPEPYACVASEADIADQVGRWRDPGRGVDRGRKVVDGIERHGDRLIRYGPVVDGCFALRPVRVRLLALG
jgi:hypothetical protein